MVMLILETFLLMLLSGLLGTAVGSLLAEAYASDEPTDRPWLRDRASHPALPALPGAPTVMSDAERDRLTASLATTAPLVSAPLAAPWTPAETSAVAETSTAAASAVPPPIEEPEVVAPNASTEPPIPDGPAVVDAEPVVEVASVAPEPVAPVPEASPPTEAPALAESDLGRASEADAHGTRPAGLLAARDGRPDDLKRIKGIGRQNEARLNALGVWHFDQIAAWTPENIRWAGSFLAFAGRIEREDWVGQAAVLAKGGTTEFAARVDAGAVPTSSS